MVIIILLIISFLGLPYGPVTKDSTPQCRAQESTWLGNQIHMQAATPTAKNNIKTPTCQGTDQQKCLK